MPESPSPPVRNTSPSREEVARRAIDIFERCQYSGHATGRFWIDGCFIDPNAFAEAVLALLPQPSEDLSDVLVMTGCRDREDLEDMARVGKSLLDAIHVVTTSPGPFSGWAPADDPTEIVTDLFNALEDAEATLSRLQAGQEPVAWRYELAQTMEPDGYGCWVERLSATEPHVPAGAIRNLTPLYASPQHPDHSGEADKLRQGGEVDLGGWIERNFSGRGVAVRREDGQPIPGEPFMSMVAAKTLVRQAVARWGRR